MLQTITLNTVEASHYYRRYYTMMVEECISLRKKRKHTIKLLAYELAITRQRLSNFEKLKLHDMALMSNYFEYYNRKLTFTIK